MSNIPTTIEELTELPMKMSIAEFCNMPEDAGYIYGIMEPYDSMLKFATIESEEEEQYVYDSLAALSAFLGARQHGLSYSELKETFGEDILEKIGAEKNTRAIIDAIPSKVHHNVLWLRKITWRNKHEIVIVRFPVTHPAMKNAPLIGAKRYHSHVGESGNVNYIWYILPTRKEDIFVARLFALLLFKITAVRSMTEFWNEHGTPEEFSDEYSMNAYTRSTSVDMHLGALGHHVGEIANEMGMCAWVCDDKNPVRCGKNYVFSDDELWFNGKCEPEDFELYALYHELLRMKDMAGDLLSTDYLVYGEEPPVDWFELRRYECSPISAMEKLGILSLIDGAAFDEHERELHGGFGKEQLIELIHWFRIVVEALKLPEAKLFVNKAIYEDQKQSGKARRKRPCDVHETGSKLEENGFAEIVSAISDGVPVLDALA